MGIFTRTSRNDWITVRNRNKENGKYSWSKQQENPTKMNSFLFEWKLLADYTQNKDNALSKRVTAEQKAVIENDYKECISIC